MNMVDKETCGCNFSTDDVINLSREFANLP